MMQRPVEMGETVHDDWNTVKSDLDELENLLRRCQAVQADVTREVARFKESREELSELLQCLNHSKSSNSNQVCLVSNFPQWVKESIQYFTEITSNLPQILQAIDRFDLDATTAKLAALETCFDRANGSSNSLPR